MQEGKFVKRKDSSELLNFNIENYLYEVKRELKACGTEISIGGKQMKKIFNQSVEMEIEKQRDDGIYTKGIWKKKDGTGKYITYKNLRFLWLDFIQMIIGITENGEKIHRIFIVSTFLLHMIKQLGIKLGEKQVAICSMLYIEMKSKAITDENIKAVLAHGLEENGYGQMSREDIYNELNELIKLGIISMKNGKYIITQKIYF